VNIPKELIFEQFILGGMGNFAYFIGCAETKEVAIVDPGWDADIIQKKADELGLKITTIILTHDHYDHVGALHDVLRLYGGNLPIYISSQSQNNGLLEIDNTKTCEDRSFISVGNIKIESIHTPGHAKDSQCLLYKNVLITGDTLFIDGCGRTDLLGGNPEELYDSLYNIIMKLPDETLLFTGHGYGPMPVDTLGNQKKTNHFLTCKSLEEFLSERM